jgi:hypothetical protein
MYIIEKVDGSTPWVSPMVVAPKPKNANEIRVCVDMREPNKAILRSRHITPTLDDMILDSNGSKVFSKMDLRNGYHQPELSEDSRFANMKRYTPKRLNNGFHILINVNFHFDILQFTYSFEYITIFITQYFTTT